MFNILKWSLESAASLFIAYPLLLFIAYPLSLTLLSIPPIIIGTGLYYWFLKPISALRALGYSLIHFLIFFAILIFAGVLIPNHIRDIFPKAIWKILTSICYIIINLLFMHFISKHPLKKIAAPAIINTIIIIATIILLDRLGFE